MPDLKPHTLDPAICRTEVQELKALPEPRQSRPDGTQDSQQGILPAPAAVSAKQHQQWMPAQLLIGQGLARRCRTSGMLSRCHGKALQVSLHPGTLPEKADWGGQCESAILRRSLAAWNAAVPVETILGGKRRQFPLQLPAAAPCPIEPSATGLPAPAPTRCTR